MNYQFGDIIKGVKTKHPIVFIDNFDDEKFRGTIITHSKKYSNNYKMKKEHFKDKDTEGKNYETYYSNSNMVKLNLIKKEEWGPYKKTGELTEEGKVFTMSLIKDMNEITWNDYILSQK